MIDFAAAVADQVLAKLASAAGRDVIAAALQPTLAEEIRRALDERKEMPRPLAEILGITAEAARGRERRDPALRALAIRSGRRRLYLTHQVLEHLQQAERR